MLGEASPIHSNVNFPVFAFIEVPQHIDVIGTEERAPIPDLPRYAIDLVQRLGTPHVHLLPNDDAPLDCPVPFDSRTAHVNVHRLQKGHSASRLRLRG